MQDIDIMITNSHARQLSDHFKMFSDTRGIELQVLSISQAQAINGGEVPRSWQYMLGYTAGVFLEIFIDRVRGLLAGEKSPGGPLYSKS